MSVLVIYVYFENDLELLFLYLSPVLLSLLMVLLKLGLLLLVLVLVAVDKLDQNQQLLLDKQHVLLALLLRMALLLALSLMLLERMLDEVVKPLSLPLLLQNNKLGVGGTKKEEKACINYFIIGGGTPFTLQNDVDRSLSSLVTRARVGIIVLV